MKKIILNYKTTTTGCERSSVSACYIQDRGAWEGKRRGGENLNPRVQPSRQSVAGVGGGRAVAGRRATGADLWCCEKK